MIRNLLKDTLLYTISSLTSRALGLFLLPFYTRVFSPADYGILSIMTISMTFIVLLISLQLDQSVARYYIAARSLLYKQAVATSGLVYYLVVFFMASIFGSIFAKPLSYLLLGQQIQMIVIVAAIYLFLSTILIYNTNLLKWRFEARKMAILSMGNVFLTIGLIVIFVGVFKIGVLGVFVGQSLSAFILIFISFWLVRSSYNFYTISFRVLSRMIQFGLPLVPAALAIYLMQYSDQLIIRKLLNLHELGLYSLAIRIASVVLLFHTGFQMAWGPHVYRNYNKPDAKVKIQKVFCYLISASLVVLLGLTVFSPELLRVFATPPFYSANIAVPYLVASIVMTSLGGYFSMGFGIAQKNWTLAYINIFGAALNIGLNFSLIPYLGIQGAGLSTFLSSGIVAIISISLSNRHYYVCYPIFKVIFLAFIVLLMLIGFQKGIGNHISIFYILLKLGMILSFCLSIFIIQIISIKEFYLAINMFRVKPGRKG